MNIPTPHIPLNAWPEWARFHANDANGKGWWFAAKPVIDALRHFCWHGMGGRTEPSGFDTDGDGWRFSLLQCSAHVAAAPPPGPWPEDQGEPHIGVAPAAATTQAETKRGKAYIAGPMTGLPGFNYPAFNAAAAALRATGWAVKNPAENPDQANYGDYLREGIRQLIGCTAIVMLPGWRDSKGAQIEHAIAVALGMEILDATQ